MITLDESRGLDVAQVGIRRRGKICENVNMTSTLR